MAPCSVHQSASQGRRIPKTTRILIIIEVEERIFLPIGHVRDVRRAPDSKVVIVQRHRVVFISFDAFETSPKVRASGLFPEERCAPRLPTRAGSVARGLGNRSRRSNGGMILRAVLSRRSPWRRHIISRQAPEQAAATLESHEVIRAIPITSTADQIGIRVRIGIRGRRTGRADWFARAVPNGEPNEPWVCPNVLPAETDQHIRAVLTADSANPARAWISNRVRPPLDVDCAPPRP